jgi:prevent-host-death family protein
MKTMQATDAKNRFGELLEEAMSEPVLIQKNGRDVAVMMSKAQFDQRYAALAVREQVKRYHEESIERFGALYEALSK